MSAVKGKAQKQKSKSKSTKQEMGSCNQKEAVLSSPAASIDNGVKAITEPLINQKQANANDKPKSKSMLSSFKKRVSKAMKSMTPAPVDESSNLKFTKMAECITESTLDDMRKRLSSLEVEVETSNDNAHKADLYQMIQALELDIRAAELEEYADALNKKQANTEVKVLVGGAKLDQSDAIITSGMIQSAANNVSAPWGDDAITKPEPDDDELINESRADRLWWFKRAIYNDSKVNTTDEIMSKVWRYSNHADRQDVINFIISKGYTCTSNENYEKITDVTKNVLKIVTNSKDSLLEEMMLQSDKIVAKVDALQSALSDIKFEQPFEEKVIESVDLGVNEDSEDISDEGSIEDDKALFLTQCLKLIESEDTVMANMWKVFIEYASTSEAGVQAKLLEDGSANKPDLIVKYNDSPIHSLNEEPASGGGGNKSFSEKKAIFETQSPELIKEDEKRRKMNAIMKDFHILHGENFEYNAHLDHLTVGDRKVHIRICPDDNQPFVFTAKNKPSNRCDIFEVLESKMYAQCEFQAKNTSDVPMLKALADRFTEYMQSYTDLQNCDGSASV